MSFTALLIHRAEVVRRSGSTDAFGQPTDSNPQQVSFASPTASFPCRLGKGTGGYANNERSRDVYEVTYTVYAEADADVREDDAIRILDVDGSVIVPNARVKLRDHADDSTTTHHLEIDITVQRGPL